MKSKILSIMLSVIMLFSTTAFAQEAVGEDADFDAESTAEADTDHRAIYEETGEYIKTLGTPEVGSVGGEWMVICLTRSGGECPDGYYENVVNYVNENINNKEQLHRAKSTDNSRVILALTSGGYDVTDVNGHNLLKGLSDMSYLKKQGINGPIWALIAFDSYNYEIPENENKETQASREEIIAYILEKQLDDGGWCLAGNKSDIDITAMAIQALAPYYDSDTLIQNAIDNALDCLSSLQLENGSFGSLDGSCSESCAQVIVALAALGIDPEEDEGFIKNGISVVDALCAFAVEGGGFEHLMNVGLDGMATEQGQCALVAYFRLLDGETSLYDMTDVTIYADEGFEDEYYDDYDYQEEIEDFTLTESDEGEEKPEENVLTDVKIPDIVNRGKTFIDISNHEKKVAIEALASRGIINGKTENSFEPDSTMTRAEFATIMVRGLGLPRHNSANFKDVTKDDWFYSYVGSAYHYGIVKGVSETEYNPNGTIKREEAAVMITRAAKLCGIDIEMNADAVCDVLDKFLDYSQSSQWAQSSLAFCCKEGILSNDVMVIMPKEEVTRGEIADMLYKMLSLGGLI